MSVSAPGVASPASVLQPLSQQQIVQQATKAVKGAYAPAFKEINLEAQRAKGLSDKRSQDNRYYQTWLDSQMQAMQAHNDAANASLEAWEKGIVGQTQALYGEQGTDLTNAANARAGNVSNNANSNAFGSGSLLAAGQKASVGDLLGAEQNSAMTMQNETNQFDAARANNVSFMGAMQSKQMSDLQDTLNKLDIARQGLASKQANDIAKAITDLQNQNVKIAEYNQNFGVVTQKLGIQAANTANEIKNRNAATNQRQQQINLSNRRLNLDISKAQQQQMNADRNYHLNLAKFDHETAKDLYEREHGLGPYKNNPHQPLGQASQNVIINKIAEVRGKLQSLIANNNYSPVEAWHILHNGGWIQTPAVAGGRPGKTYIAPVGDDGLLNAAYNTRDAYGSNPAGTGLTQGDVNYLHSLGLVIGNRLPIAPGAASSAGASQSHMRGFS